MISNVFRAYLTTKLEAGGSETTISIDRVTTLTGETITTSDFADFARGIITVNPDGDGISSYPEYISFTAVSGLTLTGAIRGLSAKSNSVVAANKRFHPDGTPVILSFGSHNIQDLLDYIDAQIGALTVGANVSVVSTAGEDITIGEGVYLKNDGKWWKWDADTIATTDGVQIGIAQSTTLADAVITNGVLRLGLDTNQSGLVTGTEYFISNTAGAIATSAGTNSRKIGVARSATNLYFDPNYGSLPTGNEKDAMAGGGDFGTPSSTNKFVTEEYGVVRHEVFTADGTYTKPTNAKLIEIYAVGAGGGGGGGASRIAGSVSGGGGGQGGGISHGIFNADTISGTVAVTVGTGGAGGAGGAGGNNDGVTGNNGEDSSFGAYLIAEGGALGTQGTASKGIGGSSKGRGNLLNGSNGGNGGEGNISAVAGGSVNSFAPTGGGGGGGAEGGGDYDGFAGGSRSLVAVLAGGTAGEEGGTAGGAGNSFSLVDYIGGTGGGGGGAKYTGGTAGAGGAGGGFGAGGGGGAAGGSSTGGGAGGAGYQGVIIVITYM